MRAPLHAASGLIALGALACVAGWRTGAPSPSRPPDRADAEPAIETPRWTSPEDEAGTFALADASLRVSLAASEPMVVAPVHLSFDEDGRLWVVEMRSYMRDADARGEGAPTGRVVVLDDADADGRFEHATTFADGLVLPRGVLACFGGALVLEPPNLLFLRDADGDGRADERRVLLSGLSGANPEHAPNALTWGLDNWIHLSQSPVEVRFDGRRARTRPTPTNGQWGMGEDEWGRLYTTPNSEALRVDLVPRHYASRNPALGAHAGVYERAVGDQRVFPASPSGVNRGYQEGVLDAQGRLAAHTAACAPLVIPAGRASALDPLGQRAHALVCEPAGMLVRWLVLDEHAGAVSGASALLGSDLLTSTDERFRPVSLARSPAGEVYIADMYRGLIQHKTYLTPYLREQVAARNLEWPIEAGRIWRLSRAGGAGGGGLRDAGAPGGPPRRISTLDDVSLARLLADPGRAAFAQRLLVERRAADARGAILEAGRAGPEALVRALWTLEGVGALRWDDAARAMEHAHPRVRIAGARLAEAWIDEPGARARVERLLADPDRFVRIQCVHSLGESRDALRALAGAPVDLAEDAIARSAIVSGLAGRETDAIDALLEAGRAGAGDRPGEQVVGALADAALRTREGASDLLDLSARRASDPRAALLASRVRSAARMGTDTPRPIDLARDPPPLAAWEGTPLAEPLRDVERWLRTPGVRPSRASWSEVDRARFERGAGLYLGWCASCHGADGRGAPGQVPALDGSDLATGSTDRLVRVLLHGLEGPRVSGGVAYDGVMPPAPARDDDELASIATYIRASWGNAGDPVSVERVRAVRLSADGRARAWTMPELESLP